MTLDQTKTLLVRAQDGVTTYIRDNPLGPDSRYYGGIWFALMVVNKAFEGNALAARTLQELAKGNLEMEGMDEAAEDWLQGPAGDS